MKIIRCFLLLSFLSQSGSAQINIADSTVQVIAYWDKAEKYEYAISFEQIKLHEGDTLSRLMLNYNIEVTVIDSTKDSYTIQWRYKDFKSSHANELSHKVISANENLKVIYKTDEIGVFKEVINYKEIKAMMQKSLKLLKSELKNIPEASVTLAMYESTLVSRDAIESNAIKDIIQFHNFHGAKYLLGEVLEVSTNAPKFYGPDPLELKITAYLDEINEEDDNYVLRSTHEVNKEQLKNATMSLLTNAAKQAKKELPKYSDIPEMTNEIHTASRIHNTGWVIYSIQTISVEADGYLNIEERIIELK